MSSLHAATFLQSQLQHGHVLHGVEDATVLRVTDEPIMAKFGLLRYALSVWESAGLEGDAHAKGLHLRRTGSD